MKQINIIPIPNFPIIEPGNDLAAIIIDSLKDSPLSIEDRDILVVAQKIVSKAEGRIIALKEVIPSERALLLSEKTKKDPKLVELILQDSNEMLAAREDGLLVVEQKSGFICANAGIDRSNVGPQNSTEQWVTLLPADADSSAASIRDRIYALIKKKVAIIINDTHGRPFREGAVGVAIGVAGIEPIDDKRGCQDLFGYRMQTTSIAIVDEISSAASMAMGQAAEGTPVVLIRGVSYQPSDSSAKKLIRAKEKDFFRHHTYNMGH
ncbi:MAG: coenzyme F420-0:L-glutamate ligase [Deltaproteobacteria bacterium]|nr:coenzyme F420-0:L-glutamate ligase [Deltaproteobacteria bacterium]